MEGQGDMISFERLPALIEEAGSRADGLIALTLDPTSGAVVGLMATRCAFEILDHIEGDSFDIFRCRDSCQAGLPIPGAFAVVCAGPEGLKSEADTERRRSALAQGLKSEDLHYGPVICIHAGEAEGLATSMGTPDMSFTCFSLAQLLELLIAQTPRAKLIDSLVRHTPVRILNPYRYRGPVDAPMFVGRRRELQCLTGMRGSFAVVGPRAIGKSSLLRRAAEVLQEEGNEGAIPNVVILTAFGANMSELDMMKELIHCFIRHYGASIHLLAHASANTLERLVEDYAARYERAAGDGGQSGERRHRILIAIDEADTMVETCPRLTEALRRCHSAGWAQVVLTGYRELRRAMSEAGSPLKNICQELPLGRLSAEECSTLVLEPMLQMRIAVESPEAVVEAICEQAGGSPSWVQLLCHHLVDAVSEDNRRVTAQMATDAMQLPPVRSFVSQWYRDSTTPFGKWLAAVASSCLPCPGADLHEQARKRLPELSRRAFESEVEDLVTASVFAYRPGGQLDFALPSARELACPGPGSGEATELQEHQMRSHLYRTYGDL
jgi:hypothetical protein